MYESKRQAVFTYPNQIATTAETMSKKDDESKSDFTVYGCTSFTAKHVLSYLMQTSMYLPQQQPLKMTLGGRNKEKLVNLQTSLQDKMSNLCTVHNCKGGFTFDIFVADSADLNLLKEMTKRTKIVLSCAGK